MRLHIIIRNMGFILLFNSIFLFISFLISAFYNEASTLPLLYSTLISFVYGIFPLIFVPKSHYINTFEGVLTVVFGWVITCLIGMLPYILYGGEFTFINAWFESVSGFTTTGASILNNIEKLPSGLLFWRSSTHWIGGIGIILFSLLILPETAKTRLILLNTEMSEIARNNFKFQTNKVLQIIAFVYIGLTLIETLLLAFFGMSFFDAINHSFATIATGGFSTKNTSISYFNSIAIEITIMIFMIISGIHFGLIFLNIIGKEKNILKHSVVRYYILFIVAGVIFTTLKLHYNGFGTWLHSLRYAAFQIISIGTTTGFATTDTANWPFFTQILLIYFTIQGACVGSTSGAIKMDRIVIFFKSITKQIKLLQHPKAIIPLKLDNKTINDDIALQTHVFILLYFFLVFISTILLAVLDIDIFTSFSGTIACLGGVGPGFANVSSLGNYSTIPDIGKFILSIVMLLGRLEIFSIISLLFLKSWK